MNCNMHHFRKLGNRMFQEESSEKVGVECTYKELKSMGSEN